MCNLTVYQCAKGTADHDSNPGTECIDCTVQSRYQDEVGATDCKTPTQCAAGFEQVAPSTVLSDNVCNECTLFVEFKPTQGPEACQAVSYCGPGFEENVEPTTTTDRDCRPCAVCWGYPDSEGRLS
jgi:hypothetical protein